MLSNSINLKSLFKKILILVLINFCFSTTYGFWFSSDDELVTVKNVDLNLFLGRWYQIARNPLFFEPENCPCAQQTLTLNSKNIVEVYNSCNKDTVNGKLQEISGTATSVDPINNSKFSIDFGLFAKGKYWIIALAPDYSWAVVTDPNRWSLYILSKTPTLSANDYALALSQAELQTDISKLKRTDHTNCTYP